MYVSSQNWLESGPVRAIAPRRNRRAPQPAALPSPSDLRRRLIGRGLGALPQLSAEHCASAWSALNPLAWLGGCASYDLNRMSERIGDVYQDIQYGPTPEAIPPPPPGVDLVTGPAAANAPGAVYAGVYQSQPVYAVPATAAQNQAAAVAAQNYAIDQARAAGWNPAGNLPLNALDVAQFWSDYKVPVLIAGGLLAAFVAWKVVTR